MKQINEKKQRIDVVRSTEKLTACEKKKINFKSLVQQKKHKLFLEASIAVRSYDAVYRTVHCLFQVLLDL